MRNVKNETARSNSTVSTWTEALHALVVVPGHSQQSWGISDIEVVSANLSVLCSIELLHDPNIWVGDTGASVSATPHLSGAVNVGSGVNSGGTVGLHGNPIIPQKVIDIDGTWINKEGVEYLDARITDVIQCQAKFQSI